MIGEVTYGNVNSKASSALSNEDGLLTFTIDFSDAAVLALVTNAHITLDALLVAITGNSTVKAQDFERIVFGGGAVTMAGNVTHTMTAPTVGTTGRIFEIALSGALTTGDVILTVTGLGDGTASTITMDASTEGCRLRWNGYVWELTSAQIHTT